MNNFSTFYRSFLPVFLKSAKYFYFIIFLILQIQVCSTANINNSLSNGENKTINPEHVHYAIVPGQTGLGGEHLQDVGAIHPYSNQHITFAETPLQYGPLSFMTGADFGQRYCQKLLHEKFDVLFERSDIHKIVFHASSQGTSSIVQYLRWVKESDDDRQVKWADKIGALILESAMLSGNSAIYHCVTQTFRWGSWKYGEWLGKLPYSYYWIPYVSKVKFPFYVPGGTQAINILEEVPCHMPVIIMHAEKDKVLPYQAAQVVYSKLKKNNDHVYFMKSIRNIHIDLLKRSSSVNSHLLSADVSKEIDTHLSLINRVCKNHSLPHSNNLVRESMGLESLTLEVSDDIVQHYEQFDMVEKFIHRTLGVIVIPCSMFLYAQYVKG
ncbi:MAG: hypothetical protein C0432_01655 [Candidatus Puniceispirillum sp.]|nr:hypothetical protein [Candidatus Pelagibacter sp.]MBA4282982.1 hypothetical protein [Candidatus Puniceispirillum sp.]